MLGRKFEEQEDQELPDTIGAICKNGLKRKTPVAVTLTKLDAIQSFLVDDDSESKEFATIFDPSITEHGLGGGFNEKACNETSRLVRKALEKCKFTHQLGMAETDLKNHRFFAVTARPDSGHNVNATMPINVTDSLLWILYQNGILRGTKDGSTAVSPSVEVHEKILRVWERVVGVRHFFCDIARPTAMIVVASFCVVALVVCGYWASQALQKKEVNGITVSIVGQERSVITNGLYQGDWKDGKPLCEDIANEWHNNDSDTSRLQILLDGLLDSSLFDKLMLGHINMANKDSIQFVEKVLTHPPSQKDREQFQAKFWGTCAPEILVKETRMVLRKHAIQWFKLCNDKQGLEKWTAIHSINELSEEIQKLDSSAIVDMCCRYCLRKGTIDQEEIFKLADYLVQSPELAAGTVIQLCQRGDDGAKIVETFMDGALQKKEYRVRTFFETFANFHKIKTKTC